MILLCVEKYLELVVFNWGVFGLCVMFRLFSVGCYGIFISIDL